MRKLFLILMLIVSLAPIVCAADDIDNPALVRSFNDVFSPDFELIGHSIALLHPEQADSGHWLLLKVRPRHAGNFTLRSEWEIARPQHPSDTKSRRQEYFLVVADTGAARFLTWQPDVPVPHPPACVGDTLIVAFAIPVHAKEVHFFREPADPRVAAIWFKSDAEAAPQAKSNADFALENKTGSHLTVQSKQLGSAMSESGSFSRHDSGVVLEAKAPGRFNLVIGPKNDPQGSTILPLVIVAKDQPLPVLAMRCEDEERTGLGSSTSWDEFDVKTLVMRVGEHVSLPCDQWTTHRGDPPQAALPHAVVLAEAPFSAQAGSFGFIGLPETPFAGDRAEVGQEKP